MGIPVICHDTCGMGVVINEMNGFKIPYIDSATSVEFIVDLLQKIVSSPDILNKRYETIWSTTNELTWDNKVHRIANKINGILT